MNGKPGAMGAVIPSRGTPGWVGLMAVFCVVGCRVQGEKPCAEIERRSLANDEQAPEGRSPQDVLVLAQSVPPLDLLWIEPEDGEAATNATASTRAVLTLRTTRGSGDAQYVVTERQGTTFEDEDCGPRLTVPVQIDAFTSDGALAETFEGELVQRLVVGPDVPDIATFRTDFDFDSLQGWLRATHDDAMGDFYTEFGESLRGWIDLTRITRDQEGASEFWAEVASWKPGTEVATGSSGSYKAHHGFDSGDGQRPFR